MKNIYSIFLILILSFFASFNVLAQENCKYVEWEKFDSIYYKNYSGDSKDLFSIVENNGKINFMKNWVIINSFDEIDLYSISLSSKWSNYSYVGFKDWKQQLIKNWINILDNKYINSYLYNLKFSEDWENFSFFIEKDNWKTYQVKNWKEIEINDIWEEFYTTVFENYTDWLKIPWYTKPYSLQFSPDFTKLSFEIKNDWVEFIVEENCNDDRSIIFQKLYNKVEKLDTLKNTEWIILNVDDFFYEYKNNKKILDLIEKKLLEIKPKLKKERSLIIYDYLIAKIWVLTYKNK